MHIRRILAAAVVVLAGAFSAAEAMPITYTLTGMSTGAVAGTPFISQPFTWTLMGDTSVFIGTAPTIGVISTSDTIQIGAATLTPTSTFIFGTNLAPEIDVYINGGLSQGIGFSSPVFTTYDGLSSIGPIPVTMQAFLPVSTNAGTLQLLSLTGLTFQASAVPEPATLALVGFGLLGATSLRRRRRRVRA